MFRHCVIVLGLLGVVSCDAGLAAMEEPSTIVLVAMGAVAMPCLFLRRRCQHLVRMMTHTRFGSFGLFVLAHLLFCFNPVFAGTWTYVSTIDMAPSGTDILGISVAGDNLIILHNSSAGDAVRVFDLNGNLLHSFPTDSIFTGGICWTGSALVFSRGNAYDNYCFYEMNQDNGSISGPFGPQFKYYPYGMTMSESYLLVSQSPGVIGRYDINHSYSLVDTINPAFLADTWGIAWDKNRNELFAYAPSSSPSTIYGLDPGLHLMETIELSGRTSCIQDIAMLNGDLLVADRSVKKIYRYAYVPEPSVLVELAGGVTCILLFIWRRELKRGRELV